jgi:hypothetical protein
MYRTLSGTAAALLLAASLTTSQAQERAGLSGRWMCDRHCILYDTGASVAIDGESAICTNEVNEVSAGRLLTDRSLRCFDMVGQLADDNKSIQWNNGAEWIRDHRRTF